MEQFLETVLNHEPNYVVFLLPFLIILQITLGSASAIISGKFSTRKLMHGAIRLFSIYFVVIIFDIGMVFFGYSELFTIVEFYIMLSIILAILKHYEQIGGPLPAFIKLELQKRLDQIDIKTDGKSTLDVEVNESGKRKISTGDN